MNDKMNQLKCDLAEAISRGLIDSTDSSFLISFLMEQPKPYRDWWLSFLNNYYESGFQQGAYK